MHGSTHRLIVGGEAAQEVQHIECRSGNIQHRVSSLSKHDGAPLYPRKLQGLHAALQLAKELGPGKRIATVVPDSAERYLSKNIFEG